MKTKIILLFMIGISVLSGYSQTAAFNYQAVIRTADNELLVNESINLRLSIIDESNISYYSENHVTTTDVNGQVNIKVGTGNVIDGTIETAPWGTLQLYLKVELSTDNGTNYSLMGESPLLGVPFAFFALNGNEGPTGNGIESVIDNGNGTLTFAFSNGTNYTTPDLTGPSGNGIESVSDNGNGTFTLNFTDGSTYTTINLMGSSGNGIESVTNNGDGTLTFNFTDGSGYTTPNLAGPSIDTNPGNLIYKDTAGWVATDAIRIINKKVGIGDEPTISKLSVKADSIAGANDPIFEVKNKDGAVVFAVYDNGVEIFVDDSGIKKGVKGGFAVGGLSGTKANGVEYLRVTPDSTRIYVKEPIKGVKGGFAVGGLSGTKNTAREFLHVSPDSVRVYIDENAAKGVKGGFAVGGLSGYKATTYDYLKVTPESTNVLVKPSAKGVKGGFAVGGLSGTKVINNDLLHVSADSVRIYIDESSTKGVKGGFAVGGLSGTKASGAEYFNVEFDTLQTIDPSEARILWYPVKSAFLTGQVLVESPDSIGTNSFSSGFENKAIGDYSQSLGYSSRSEGKFSTAIGNYAQAIGSNSFAIGDSAYAVGSASFAIGSISRDTAGNPTNNPTLAYGNYSIALGVGANATGLGSMALGASNTASGDWSTAIGRQSEASMKYAVAIGTGSLANKQYATAIGFNAKATNNYGTLALGYEAEANGTRSLAVGKNAIANSVGATAIGRNAYVNGSYALAINGTSSGFQSVAIQGTAAGNQAIAIGEGAETTDVNNIAIGYNSYANATGAIAIGGNANANAVNTLALGSSSNAQIYASTALGSQANAPIQFATALGYSSNAAAGNSISIGDSDAKGNYTVAIGGQGVESNDAYEIVLGRYPLLGTGSTSTWVNTDRLFVIGNGSSTSARGNAMVLYKNGNLQIAGTLSSAKGISIEGNASKKGSSTWLIPADANNIKSSSTFNTGLDAILKLNPKQFKSDNQSQIGLIAQEVENIIPEAVVTNNKGEKELDMHSINIALINAIKDLKKENDVLKSKIEEINKKIK